MIEFHPLSVRRCEILKRAGLEPESITELIVRTIREDLGGGEDVTSIATVEPSQRSVASFASRGEGRLCGVEVAGSVIEIVASVENVLFEVFVSDGDTLQPGQVVARVEAPTRALLLAERTSLNLLCHLSGVATLTARWVAAVSETDVIVRDTRKTTPGLRELEKYAVRCGGGQNHRRSLSDAALIKDNHVLSAGGVASAVARVRAHAPKITIEVEVDTLVQLEEALAAGVDLVLLDNMAPDLLRDAVAITRANSQQTGREVLLEASGGLELASAREVAMTGVNFLAVGALTHSAPVLDLGLDFENRR